MYPYHDDPTTVFWRQDQHCIPKKISRYVILGNGDTVLHHYQRSFSTHYTSGSQIKNVTVNHKGSQLTDISYSHSYDTLERKIYYEERRPNPNPPYNLILSQSKQFFYHGNTPWLDSVLTTVPYTSYKRDIFHYEPNDRLTKTDHFYRNLPNAPWIKSGFDSRIYDVNGQLTRIEVYGSEPSEKLTLVMDINYNNTNRISTITTTNAVTNLFSKKYAYIYNDADSITTQILYRWYNNEWIYDGQKSIDLGYGSRVDESNTSSSVGSKLTLKYSEDKICPYLCFDDWLNLNQHYLLYFTYPTTETGEPAKDDIPLSVYPNPSDGLFWIESPVESRLTLQDLLGRIIWQGISTGKDQLVLPSGTRGQLLLQATLNKQTAVKMILIQ